MSVRTAVQRQYIHIYEYIHTYIQTYILALIIIVTSLNDITHVDTTF